ncbi:MAG: cell division protein FtsZ [Kiritimatiellia bacterium]|jgi:cell division protein FtsZ|nr:cell division protein FtsZ [Kiritimatiellia bacterium]MDP6847842.1 cell division protein FtsZ [Kiritimatiellia bacterium]
MIGRKISVVGIGGAGARIVGQMPSDADDGPITFAVDTDTCSLVESSATERIQIGEVVTAGFGTGGDTQQGREAAEHDTAKILAMLENMELVVVVAGLGGGVGGGATPVVLGAAQEAGAATVCFVTLPFDFEGAQRKAAAAKDMEALREICDTVVVVRNNSLFESVDSRDIAGVFKEADSLLSSGVYSLYQMLALPGYLRLDLADLRRLSSDTKGECLFAAAGAEGEDRASKAVESLLTGSLMEQGKLAERARLLMLSIVGGPDLTLKEIGQIMDGISSTVRPQCRVVMGTSVDDGWIGRISLMAIVGEKRKVRPQVETEIPQQPVSEHPAEGPPLSPIAAQPSKKRKRRPRQERLKLEASGRGRFKDVEPTILDGEDMDVPTFIRRGMRIEK